MCQDVVEALNNFKIQEGNFLFVEIPIEDRYSLNLRTKIFEYQRLEANFNENIIQLQNKWSRDCFIK